MHLVQMSRQEMEAAVETAREVAQEFRRIGPEADANNVFAHESVALMKDSGLIGLPVPKEYGGMGADIWTLSRVVTELAYGDAAIALAYNMHYCMVAMLLGNLLPDDQKKVWLPRVAEGALVCGTFSEDRGFGGLADTKAIPQSGGGWRLYGKKSWATVSEVADIWTGSATITDADGNIPADFDERVGAENLFVADFRQGDVEGVRIERTWDALGMRATGTHTVHFDGYFVPEDSCVGNMRGGLLGNLEWASLTFASVYHGIGRRAYDETREILLKKNLGATFSTTVGENVRPKEVGFIQDGLGWMLAQNEITRRTIHSTCQMLLAGDDDWDAFLRTPMIAVAKVRSTESTLDVIRKAMHLVGGSSFRRGHPLERLYRDAASGSFQPLTEEQTYSAIGALQLGGE